MTGWDDDEEVDVDRAPICGACGVTALPAAGGLVAEPAFVCENPDCEAFGEDIG